MELGVFIHKKVPKIVTTPGRTLSLVKPFAGSKPANMRWDPEIGEWCFKIDDLEIKSTGHDTAGLRQASRCVWQIFLTATCSLLLVIYLFTFHVQYFEQDVSITIVKIKKDMPSSWSRIVHEFLSSVAVKHHFTTERGMRQKNIHIQGCAKYYARGDSVALEEFETEVKNALSVCRGDATDLYIKKIEKGQKECVLGYTQKLGAPPNKIPHVLSPCYN